MVFLNESMTSSFACALKMYARIPPAISARKIINTKMMYYKRIRKQTNSSPKLNTNYYTYQNKKYPVTALAAGRSNDTND